MQCPVSVCKWLYSQFSPYTEPSVSPTPLSLCHLHSLVQQGGPDSSGTTSPPLNGTQPPAQLVDGRCAPLAVASVHILLALHTAALYKARGGERREE